MYENLRVDPINEFMDFTCAGWIRMDNYPLYMAS